MDTIIDRRALFRLGLASAAVAAIPASVSAAPVIQPDERYGLFLCLIDRTNGNHSASIVIEVAGTDAVVNPTGDVRDETWVPFTYSIAHLVRAVVAEPEKWTE